MSKDLISFLAEQGYENLRELEDGTVVGTQELMFTTAICIDLNWQSWDKRFCFKEKSLAISEIAKLQTCDDEPTGYVARRNS
jgi:hypothetical protein